MNLEQILNKVLSNRHSLRNKKTAFFFLKKQYAILLTKKNKLKLGAISFEIKRHFISEIPLTETIEIRYIKQDNTAFDSLNLENRLNQMKWKWNLVNILSFCLIFFISFNFFYAHMYWLYCDQLSSFFIRNYNYEEIIKKSFILIFHENYLIEPKFKNLNYWITNALIDITLRFSLIF